MEAIRFLNAGILAVVGLALGTPTFGQPEIRWQPVSSDCDNAIVDNTDTLGLASEIILHRAPGCGECTVVFEILCSGWANAPGVPQLGTYQGQMALGGVSYVNGIGDDLYALNWPGTQAELKEGAFIDTARADFVFFNKVPIAAVDVSGVDYRFGSTQMGGAVDDMGGFYYGGTLTVTVPVGAAGTYTFGWAVPDTMTFFNDQIGQKIPGLVRTPGLITDPLGRCCYNLPDVLCVDDVTECGCAAMPSPRTWWKGVLCPPAGPSCNPCLDDSSCNDYNRCTDDACIEYECYNDPNYDPAYCCNPASGALILIDDDDECTEDVCDADGSVDHNPLTGADCTHENVCVINGICDAGVCVGDLPVDLMIACAEDDDCPAGWFCNQGAGDPMEGFCDCSETTPLCIFFDDVCYEEGDPVYTTLQMGAGSSIVTGFQALMTYDPSCLEFVSMGPCAGDEIFDTVVDSWVDEDAGKIWYAAIGFDEDTFDIDGYVGTYDLMCMDFIKLPGCDPCHMCIISENPHNTLLVSDQGQSIGLLLCDCEPGEEPDGVCNCSGDVMLDGPITMTVPPGAMVNADCGLSTAEVLWDAPYAEDECLGPLDLDCILEHDGGVPLPPGMIMTGGVFPQGTTYFSCTAEDTVCGSQVTKVWIVSVSDQHTLDVEVHMQPTMAVASYDRCICFDLYMDCVAPEHMCAVMTFGGPWNFLDHARAELKVDKGNYLCIEARDPYHTLRSTAAVECLDNKWTAVFKGDPLLGSYGDAHWLIGGNLDYFEPGGNQDVIDILDFGVFMYQFGECYGPETCPEGRMAAPQADIDGNGCVDAGDYSYLTMNFLADSKIGCCEEPGAVDHTPITSITIKELRQRGLGHLAVADLNGDGVLDTADMEAFMQGATPTVPTKVQRPR